MADHAERLVEHVFERAVRHAQHAAIDLVGPPGVVLEVADGGLDLVERLVERLAVLAPTAAARSVGVPRRSRRAQASKSRPRRKGPDRARPAHCKAAWRGLDSAVDVLGAPTRRLCR